MDRSDTEVERLTTRPARRWGRVVAVAIALLLVLEIAASMVWPHVVPRLAVLPRPPAKAWNDGCNDHYRYYERSGPFWQEWEDSTTIACID